MKDINCTTDNALNGTDVDIKAHEDTTGEKALELHQIVDENLKVSDSNLVNNIFQQNMYETQETLDDNNKDNKDQNSSTLSFPKESHNFSVKNTQILTRMPLSCIKGCDEDDDEDTNLNLKAKIEALLFASPKPLTVSDIIALIDESLMPSQIEEIIFDIQEEFRKRKGGFRLAYIKGVGYQFRTAKGAQDVLTNLFAVKPRPLSRSALETLAIIAYRQPVTRAAIEYIRGTDCGSIIKNLMEKNLIKCVGRKEIAGKPMLFGTTEEFLRVFKLNSLDELPSLSSFQTPLDIQTLENQSLDDTTDNELNNNELEQTLLGDEEKSLVSDGILDDNPKNQPC